MALPEQKYYTAVMDFHRNITIRSFVFATAGFLGTACGDKTLTAPPIAGTPVAIAAGAAAAGSAAYGTNPLTVAAGTTIVWSNKDGQAHTVTSNATGFDSGRVESGQTYSYTFATPGTYAYHCTIHPSMMGSIVVQ